MDYKSYQFMGIKVHALTMNNLIDIVLQNIKENNKIIIGHHNLHSLYLTHKNKVMDKFYKINDYTHIDGMSIIWLGKLLGKPLKPENRLTSLDWLNPLLKVCNTNQVRLFFLGSKPGVAQKAGDYFSSLYKGITIKTHHGYFQKQQDCLENQKVLQMINEFEPHILMVGMGMPIQEQWIYENYKKINANIIWSLGAFMDYYAGVIPTPPRWMGRFGLEWLYRLYCEPKRLFKRYLIEPWFILYLLIIEIFKSRTELNENK